MSPRPRVKICGITSKEDARLALDEGADRLGIIVYAKSPRAVSFDQARDLCGFIPAGRRVMVDVKTGTDELEAYGDLGFDAYQISIDLDTSLATVAAWAGLVGPEQLWLSPRVPPGEPFPQVVLEFADTIVLDTYDPQKHGGTGRTGDWVKFMEWQTLYQHKRWVLTGGLSPTNIRAALAATQAQWVDVNSGLESAPGRKDPAKVRELFRVLRSA